jgi:hypothetical protein
MTDTAERNGNKRDYSQITTGNDGYESTYRHCKKEGNGTSHRETYK